MLRFSCFVLAGLLTAVPLEAWAQQPLPVPQTEPARNTRLILKDGSYQRVRDYRIEGSRVIYRSIESGNIEELPADLVDWPATKRWAIDHGAALDSPGVQAARELDREEQTGRMDALARMPMIAPGLYLPDMDAMFLLDLYRDRVEAIELRQTSGMVHQRERHVERAEIAALAARHRELELDGDRAAVRLHRFGTEGLVLYLSLPDDPKATAPSGALMVDTHGASSAIGTEPSPAASRFVLLKLEERNGERAASAALLHVADAVVHPNASRRDRMNAEGAVWPLTLTPLPGGHWMKLNTASVPERGEYAVVELLEEGVVNLAVWDFAIDPQAPENAHGIEAELPHAPNH